MLQLSPVGRAGDCFIERADDVGEEGQVLLAASQSRGVGGNATKISPSIATASIALNSGPASLGLRLNFPSQGGRGRNHRCQ
jgi:hypothetical protein